jgi:hypothetical protein
MLVTLHIYLSIRFVLFEIIMCAYFIMVLDMLLLVTDSFCSFPGGTLVYTVYKYNFITWKAFH